MDSVLGTRCSCQRTLHLLNELTSVRQIQSGLVQSQSGPLQSTDCNPNQDARLIGKIYSPDAHPFQKTMDKCDICFKKSSKQQHQCIVCNNVYETIEMTAKHQRDRGHIGGHHPMVGPLTRTRTANRCPSTHLNECKKCCFNHQTLRRAKRAASGAISIRASQSQSRKCAI
jgi:hypothetical protein